MIKINVSASGNYEICIQRGLLSESGRLTAGIKAPCKVLIVSDCTVSGIYGDTVAASFDNAGFAVSNFVFPAGEVSKNISTLTDILENLGRGGFDRGDLIVALGGGVTGDLSGFAAAVFLRGIDYVQIPTTLLAAVDSSVGGKTGIDLSCGKNMAGCFWQPRLVICDSAAFDTLSSEIFADGLAEVIKYGVIRDEALFRSLGRDEVPDIESVVSRCCTIKTGIVERDERESGERKLLNFGHTIGHAVEKASNFSISHGRAVAIGMAAISRAAERFGLCAPGTAEEICQILLKYSLPIRTDIPTEDLCRAARSDKKRSGAGITVVIPAKLGAAELKVISMDELDAWIVEGMKP